MSRFPQDAQERYERKAGYRPEIGRGQQEGEWERQGYGLRQANGMQGNGNDDFQGRNWGKVQEKSENSWEKDRFQPISHSPSPQIHHNKDQFQSNSLPPSKRPFPGSDPTAGNPERALRLRKQEEFKRLLDEQSDERRKRQMEERQAQLVLEKAEEERVKRQQKEMEEEYRREMRSRQGLGREQEREERQEGKYEVPEYHRPSAHVETVQPPQYSPQIPVPRPIKRPTFPTPPDFDPFKARDRDLQNLLTRLKEESLSLNAQHQAALQELNSLRRDLHRPSLYPTAMEASPGRFIEKSLRQESRFVPIMEAGRRVIGRMESSYPSYIKEYTAKTEAEGADASQLLTQLDGILEYWKGN